MAPRGKTAHPIKTDREVSPPVFFNELIGGTFLDTLANFHG